MKKEFRVSIVLPNRPEGLALLVQARSLKKAVEKLRYSSEFQLPIGQYVVHEAGHGANCISIALKPAFVKILRISQKEARVINEYLQAKTPDQFQGKDNTISHTVTFSDGKQMDIKCCGAREEKSWTEAVLFDENGCELCCSDVSDRYDTTWELEYQDRRYVAIVRFSN